MKRIREKLALAFYMIDIGPLAFYVGLKIIRNQKKKIIKLLQLGYTEKLLDRHGMLKTKTAKNTYTGNTSTIL